MSHQEQPESGTAAPAPLEEPTLTALSLHPEDWALFLDIDGTLLDLAQTPDAIVVPRTLPSDLNALSKKLGGALALVTGRTISLVDSLFFPFRFPVAGLHGAEWRTPDGQRHRIAIPPAFTELKRAIAFEAKAWPGVLVEDKGAAVGAHYRLAPEYQQAVEQMMLRHAAAAGPQWTLQRGKMVVEIRPAKADKGDAVEAFLACGEFRGRRPLAIGDDLTDEAMFCVANEHQGYSIQIGSPSTETAARGFLSSAADLRQIIGRLAT